MFCLERKYLMLVRAMPESGDWLDVILPSDPDRSPPYVVVSSCHAGEPMVTEYRAAHLFRSVRPRFWMVVFSEDGIPYRGTLKRTIVHRFNCWANIRLYLHDRIEVERVASADDIRAIIERLKAELDGKDDPEDRARTIGLIRLAGMKLAELVARIGAILGTPPALNVPAIESAGGKSGLFAPLN